MKIQHQTPLLMVTVFFTIIIVATVAAIHIAAMNAIETLPESLTGLLDEVRKPQIKDRAGRPITVTYANRWNSGSYAPLYQIPEMIKTLFIVSEDKRFYSHDGVDWLARFHALIQNLLSLEAVRGGSTISEQVVRMIHPRPRTLWSRFMEGTESQLLEQKHTKADILEFYLNQIPYASNRRGIVQAASYYFNRSLETLTLKEMMMLVVLVRAPSYYDPYREKTRIEPPIRVLAKDLLARQIISKEAFSAIITSELILEKPVHVGDAAHFARFVYQSEENEPSKKAGEINTTLDLSLQTKVVSLMDKSLTTLSEKKVRNGACLVANHETGEILAWVSRAISDDYPSGEHIDGVIAPRQPGSSLKPFLYALAIEKGFTAAQEIEDTPLTNAVGRGLHAYHNYSRIHYGWVTLREALGNSLNIPAVKTIRFVGSGAYLSKLHELGFNSLNKSAGFYGEGLALGSGEVSLFELVQGYAILANRGRFMSLYGTKKGLNHSLARKETPVFSEETASLIANILADANARKLEFGRNGLLNFPVETAVKTGTSTDYKDSWAVGFNHRYVAGVWMGNFDARPTNGVTGSLGPALLLRSVFAELNRNDDTRPLFLSPKLMKHEICVNSPDTEHGACARRFEWFAKGVEPHPPFKPRVAIRDPLKWIKPTDGLEMAMDPRIPDENEAFFFELQGVTEKERVTWRLDGKVLGTQKGNRYRWPLTKGKHELEARIENDPAGFSEKIEKTYFVVK